MTDTSAKAEALAEQIGEPIRTLLQRLRTDPADGAPYTPCFEYTGPDNRIVIRYESPGLTLLAVRRITDGEYWSTNEVARAWSEALGPDGGHPALALIRPILYPADHGHGKPGYAQRLTTDVQGWNPDTEGVVVAFEPSGHRVKVKSRQYLALHRARDDYSAESRVLTVLMDGNHEQLLERLSAERKGRLTEYYRRVNEGITTTAAEVARDAAAVWDASAGDRKTAPIRWIEVSGTNNGRRMLGFAVFDALTRGGDALETARSTILKTVQRYCRKQRDIDEKVRRLLGADPPTWNPPGRERWRHRGLTTGPACRNHQDTAAYASGRPRPIRAATTRRHPTMRERVYRLLDRLFSYEPIPRTGPTVLHRWIIWRWKSGAAVYIHNFIGSESRDPHNHPKRFLTIGLKGSYREVQYTQGEFGTPRTVLYKAPWIRRFETSHIHRIELEPGGSCWTLAFVGATTREWGFYPDPPPAQDEDHPDGHRERIPFEDYADGQ